MGVFRFVTIRSTRSRGAVASERGITLLEVTVAMALFATGVLATVSIVDSGTELVAESQRRVQATQLATGALEQLRSVPYDDIGHSVSDPDFVASFEGLPTVRVASTTFPARSVATQGSTSFSITRHIAWSDDDEDASPPRFKLLTAIVEWDVGRPGSVRLDTAVVDGRHAPACAQPFTDATESVRGEVNTYLPGRAPVDPGAGGVPVGLPRGSTPVGVGDLLLVVQMGGPDAGRYEYATAAGSVRGGWLAVTGDGAFGGLVNGYGVGGPYQVVRVPTYGDVTVDRQLVAGDWNGETGGVLAIDVTGTLRAAAGLDATRALPGDLLVGAGEPTPSSWTRAAPAGKKPVGPLDAGGLIAVRAAAVVDGAFTSTGNGNGSGGVIVVQSTAAPTGLVDVDVSARANGAGGTAIVSRTIGAVTTGGKGGPGAVVTHDGDLVGVGGRVGCAAAVEVLKAASTPTVATAKGAIGAYTITVRNAPLRGAATSVVISDVLPSGTAYLSTQRVELTGGATRVTTDDPAVGALRPTWGSFSLPPGATVRVSFSVGIGATPAAVVLQNAAAVTYRNGDEFRRADYLSASGVEDDIAVSPFACLRPWTDESERIPAGVVNTYHPGAKAVAAGATTLAVGASVGAKTPIADGDLLLVIQAQDARIDPGDDDDYGDGPGPLVAAGSTDLGTSGRYEYVMARGPVTDGAVAVSGAGAGGGLLFDYFAGEPDAETGARTFQVVRVPTYPSAVLSEHIVALPWDGAVGGIVAVDVAGTLTLDGGILDASAAGFRGGGVVARPGSGSPIATGTSDRDGGSKGEGVAGTPQYLASAGRSPVDTGIDGLPGGSFGSGAPGNAGGGGALGAGGGGGANRGAGGDGAGDGGGRGGASADGRVLFGGGGGAAAAPNLGRVKGGVVGEGGRGGGVVMVRALEITGVGAVLANGTPGATGGVVGKSRVGAGGGGAGGTVVVSTTAALPGTVSVQARGGDGGPTGTVAGGGAGGGGWVLASMSTVPDVRSGDAGAGTGAVGGGAAAGAYGSAEPTAIEGLALGVGCLRTSGAGR